LTPFAKALRLFFPALLAAHLIRDVSLPAGLASVKENAGETRPAGSDARQGYF